MPNKKNLQRSSNLIELSGMFKALAHPSRMAIVFLLCSNKENRMTVLHIYKELNMTQPVISRHLGILKNCGLLLRVTEGQKTFYELNSGNRNAQHITGCFSSLK